MKLQFLIGLLLAGMLNVAYAEQVHKVAVRLHSGIEAGIKQWRPTLEFLSATIPGHRFELIPYPRLAQQVEDAKHKNFDFVLTNPATYIEINKLTGAQALVTLINRRQGTSQTRFGGVIFTRADRDDILSLNDLKHKHLIAVSPLGFGGWEVAWREMLHNDLDPSRDLGQLSFADGNQPAVVKAVYEGKADAGVVRTDMLERLAEQGVINLTELRVLHNIEIEGFPFFLSTPLYPEWPFAAMPTVNKELAMQVKQALLNMREYHPAARAGHYFGWTEALDYQSVDDLLKELHAGPYKNTGTNQFHYFYLVALLLIAAILFLSLKRSAPAR